MYRERFGKRIDD